VRYPGIANAFKSDFGPASVAIRVASWVYPAAQIDGFIDEARARVLEECDYRAEARNQIAAATRFAGHRLITIPAVHPAYSSERVLTTTFVDGVHLDELLAASPSQDVRDRLGTALHAFYVGSLLKWGVLPGDPHPGNYLVTPDGKVAIIDHGCTRVFDVTGETLVRVARVLQAPDRASAYRASTALRGEALLPLRVRFGLTSVLARLETRADWRELVSASASLDPIDAPAPLGSVAAAIGFEVVLLDPGTRTIEIVREIRDLFGVGIREAKDLLDRAPHTLKRTADRDEAEALKRRLEASGAIIELRSAAPDAAS
jgi:ribosomal protein L7/L12